MRKICALPTTLCCVVPGMIRYSTDLFQSMSSPFNDPHAVRLLSRVREDLAQLRHDVATLASHTTHRTLPDGARDIAANARQHFAAGTSYAADRLRSLRSAPPRDVLGVAGGIVVVGLLALGVAALCKGSSQQAYDEDEY